MPTTKMTTRGVDYNICADSLTAQGFSPWYRFGAGTVIASIGSAQGAATGPTAVTSSVQRSSTDPNDPTFGATPENVSATAISGNPSTGSAVSAAYTEAGVGWWRFNTTAFTAGTTQGVTVLTGPAAN